MYIGSVSCPGNCYGITSDLGLATIFAAAAA